MGSFITKAILVSVVALVGVILSFQFRNQNFVWYQNVRIEAETPNGSVHSDTVIRVIWSRDRLASFLGTNTWTRQVFGRAPMLDLKNGSALFVLLTPDGLSEVLGDNSGILNYNDRLAALVAGRVPDVTLTAPTGTAPFLVSIRDLTDISTIALVGSDESELQVSGIGVVTVTVSPVSEREVSTDFDIPLPFLSDPSLKQGQLASPSSPNAFQVKGKGWAYATIISFLKE